MSSIEHYYVASYVAFIFAAIILCVVIALATELLGLAAARTLYVSMLRNVVSAPMRSGHFHLYLHCGPPHRGQPPCRGGGALHR